jgi:hypothetical protein
MGPGESAVSHVSGSSPSPKDSLCGRRGAHQFGVLGVEQALHLCAVSRDPRFLSGGAGRVKAARG